MRQLYDPPVARQQLLDSTAQLVKQHHVRGGLAGAVLGAPPALRVVEEVLRLVRLADLVERRLAAEVARRYVLVQVAAWKGRMFITIYAGGSF